MSQMSKDITPSCPRSGTVPDCPVQGYVLSKYQHWLYVLKNIPARHVGAVAMSIKNWVDPKYSVVLVVQLSLIGILTVLAIYYFAILPLHLKSRFMPALGPTPWDLHDHLQDLYISLLGMIRNVKVW